MTISTEGRIFIAHLTRNLAARERAGANLLSPGVTKWAQAFHDFGRTMARAGGPVKAAKLFHAAYNRFRGPLPFRYYRGPEL
jgi:hypothetical protein